MTDHPHNQDGMPARSFPSGTSPHTARFVYDDPTQSRYDWETPASVFDPLQVEFGFQVDASAAAHNTKCAIYMDKVDNALNRDWRLFWCDQCRGIYTKDNEADTHVGNLHPVQIRETSNVEILRQAFEETERAIFMVPRVCKTPSQSDHAKTEKGSSRAKKSKGSQTTACTKSPRTPMETKVRPRLGEQQTATTSLGEGVKRWGGRGHTNTGITPRNTGTTDAPIAEIDGS
jgi:hypothetical protein